MAIRTSLFVVLVAGSAMLRAAEPEAAKPARIDAETIAALNKQGAEYGIINLASLSFSECATDLVIPSGSIPGFSIPSEKIAGLPQVKVPFGLRLRDSKLKKGDLLALKEQTNLRYLCFILFMGDKTVLQDLVLS